MKVFIHRYKWSHAKLRKMFRRKLRERKVRLLETVHNGWLYEIHWPSPKGEK